MTRNLLRIRSSTRWLVEERSRHLPPLLRLATGPAKPTWHFARCTFARGNTESPSTLEGIASPLEHGGLVNLFSPGLARVLAKRGRARGRVSLGTTGVRTLSNFRAVAVLLSWTRERDALPSRCCHDFSRLRRDIILSTLEESESCVEIEQRVGGRAHARVRNSPLAAASASRTFPRGRLLFRCCGNWAGAPGRARATSWSCRRPRPATTR